ncbi:MAG: DNA primase [bacterium]
MDQNLIEEILNRLSLVEIASEYLKLTPSGSEFKALCPFHQEKTPSFTISPTKNLYYCFGCGAGGNLINFIMEMEKLDFNQALEFLAKKAGIEITGRKYQTWDKLYKIMDQTADYYHRLLVKGYAPQYSQYLEKRGIDQQMIKTFKLGAAIKKVVPKFKEKKTDLADLEQAGLIIKKPRQTVERFYDRLIFPIFDVKGRIIALGGRSLKENTTKYVNSPQTPIYSKNRTLYGLNIAKKHLDKTRKVYLVEGYLDLITMHQYGYPNTVASLGTSLTSNQATLLSRFTDQVIIGYDNDAAGIRATQRAISILLKLGMEILILNLGEYKDPDDFLRNNSSPENLSQHSVSWIDFMFNLNPLNTPGAKKKFAHQIKDLLSEIDDSVLKIEWSKKIAYRLGLNPSYFYTPANVTNHKNLSKPIIGSVKISKNTVLILIKALSTRDDHIGAKAVKFMKSLNLTSPDNEFEPDSSLLAASSQSLNKFIQAEISRLEFCDTELAEKSLQKYIKKYHDIIKKEKCDQILDQIRQAQLQGKDTRKLEIKLDKILREK